MLIDPVLMRKKTIQMGSTTGTEKVIERRNADKKSLTNRPADPLRVLGEFLLKRSAEVETGAASKEDHNMNGAE